MKVLFIGGTGIISSACTALCLERGSDLHLLNRGQSNRPVPAGAKIISADIRIPQQVEQALGNHQFDAVVDWVAFTPNHIQADLDLFAPRTRQYLFISSASAYQTPPSTLPVRESTLLDNPVWQYSRDKIACEELLNQAYRQSKFPYTIVRPSHTYDRTLIPLHGGWTNLDRMLKGQKIVVHGDGTSLWTLTHHRDFAKGLVGLLGNSHAIGETYHITSDEWLTWDQIAHLFAEALGVKANIVHIPSDVIAAFDKDWGDGLLGDKAASMVFDNSKIKQAVPDFICTTPFSQGAREIVAWYKADPARQVVDDGFNALCDRMIAAMESIKP